MNVKAGDLALCIMESSSHLSDGGESRLSFPNMWINSAKSMCMDALNSMPWYEKSIPELGSNSVTAGKGYRCLEFEFGNSSSPDHGWTDQMLPCPSIAPQTEATFDGGGLDQVSGWPFKFTQALVGGGAWMSGYPSFPFIADAVHKMNRPAEFSPFPSATMADEYMRLQQPVLPANWLVEDYVCRQTEPLRYCRTAGNPTERSAYRRAADTLAKSNLNPNAEVFTPKKAALVMAASEKAEEASGTDPLPAGSSGVAESVALPGDSARQQAAAEEADVFCASIAVESSSSPRPLLDRR